tara:strand:+ start:4213 stop:4785 length:573 start_codon:yes stop_codon:yes gene_type:complete
MKKVAERIENYFIKAISSGEYSQGGVIPSEREIANTLNVDRCSLRTVLKGIEKDGWISTIHGKPTSANLFFENCNLNAALKRISLVNDSISESLKRDAQNSLLELATTLFRDKDEYISLLKSHTPLPKSEKEFLLFEINFIEELTDLTQNKIYKLLLNQLLPIFKASTASSLNCQQVNLRRKQYAALLTN